MSTTPPKHTSFDKTLNLQYKRFQEQTENPSWFFSYSHSLSLFLTHTHTCRFTRSLTNVHMKYGEKKIRAPTNKYILCSIEEWDNICNRREVGSVRLEASMRKHTSKPQLSCILTASSFGFGGWYTTIVRSAFQCQYEEKKDKRYLTMENRTRWTKPLSHAQYSLGGWQKVGKPSFWTNCVKILLSDWTKPKRNCVTPIILCVNDDYCALV